MARVSLIKCFEYGMIGKENNLRNSKIRCRIYTGCSVRSRNVVSKMMKKSYMLAMWLYFRVIVTFFLDKLCLHTPTKDVQNELAAELEVLLSPLVKVLLIKY